MLKLKSYRLALIVSFLLALNVCVRAEVMDFGSTRWTMVNADTSEYLGQKCLFGTAYLEDVAFTNGIIEVDIAVQGPCSHVRSYPGIVFRKQSAGDYEHFYIRPHRSGLYTDALQYTPAFNNIDSWQLYNGEGATSGIDSLPVNRWFHLKAEIAGTQCKIYIDGAVEPNLVITDLKHGVSTGSIGVNGPRDPHICFANFQYTIDDNLRFDAPPQIETPFGTITTWELSPPFPLTVIDFEHTPEQQGKTGLTWQTVHSDASGLVDVSRYMGQSSRAGAGVWARTTLSVAKEEVREFQVGYSDAVSVFLNGQILYFGTSGYQQRDPSFLGIIGLFDDVFLPLKKGDNELMLLIAESFGGWGFMCRDADTVFQHESMSKLWDVQYRLAMPESAVYDEKRNVLYVSNNFNDGNEFISKIGLDGTVKVREWITGLNRPTGMAIANDLLYVVERRNLVVINLDSGIVVNKYPVEGAGYINDIAFDDLGHAYISDTRNDAILKFADGAFEVWLTGDEVDNPNALFVDGDRLLYGNYGDGCLKSANLADRQIRTIAHLGREANIDGLTSDGNGNYIISAFNGRVYSVTPSGATTLLLDTTAPGIFCADLEYIKEKQLMVIPSLFENRLMAYRYGGGN